MSLVIPGLGKTITPKRRRPSPKTKIIGRGKVTANPYVTDNKPRPKLGSKPRGGKVTPPSGVVNDKPRPKSGGRAIPRPPRMEKPSPRPVKPKLPKSGGKAIPRPGRIHEKPSPRPVKPKRPVAARPTSSSGVKRRPRPAAAGAANKPKQPVRAPRNRRITASGKRFGGRPMSSASKPKQTSRASSRRRATAPVKRYGYGKRPMGLLSRRPRGRR